jgi:hypothetical protein
LRSIRTSSPVFAEQRAKGIWRDDERCLRIGHAAGGGAREEAEAAWPEAQTRTVAMIGDVVRACSPRRPRGNLPDVALKKAVMEKPRRPRMLPVSVATYREDPLYQGVARAVDDLLQHGKVVAPVDVLIGMGLLTREHVEDWRRGRVAYLERVINCNLTRLSRLLRILRFHAHDLHLKPSWTAYMRWGKGPKQRLRFTKTGDSNLEEAYATHFVWPGKGPFYPPAPKEGR